MKAFKLNLLVNCLAYFALTQSLSGQGARSVLFIVDSTSDMGPAKKETQTIKNFYYHDIGLNGHPVSLDKDSKIIINNAPFFLLRADAQQTPYLIYPGDSICVQYLPAGEVKMYIPGNIERTNELDFFARLVKATDNLSYAFKPKPFAKKVNSSIELTYYESLIHKIKQKRVNFLNTYNKSCQISKSFYNTALQCINAVAINDSLDLYAVNYSYLSQSNMLQKKIEEKKRSVMSAPLTNLRYPLKTLYAIIVLHYGEIDQHKLKNMNDVNNQLTFINNNFSGKYKEYLKFKTFSDALNNNVEVSQSELSGFSNSLVDSNYMQLLKTKLAANAKLIATDQDALIDVNENKSTLSSVIKSQTGNIILIDVWASWCAPCRDEMKYSKNLQKHFEGKPVRFIYLSVDEDKESWLNANKNEKLDKGSFLLSHPDIVKIVQTDGVISVPKYILIDKDKRIISSDAPRPSDPKLKELLNKYLD